LVIITAESVVVDADRRVENRADALYLFHVSIQEAGPQVRIIPNFLALKCRNLSSQALIISALVYEVFVCLKDFADDLIGAFVTDWLHLTNFSNLLGGVWVNARFHGLRHKGEPGRSLLDPHGPPHALFP
jgi:hypothetical protein